MNLLLMKFGVLFQAEVEMEHRTTRSGKAGTVYPKIVKIKKVKEPEVFVDYSVYNPDGSAPKPFKDRLSFEVDTSTKAECGWLKDKIDELIDDFIDINPDEKEIMKLWNDNWLTNNYIGDLHVPIACKTFIDVHGHHLFARNMYKTFVLFLTTLYNFGLLSCQEARRMALYYNSVKNKQKNDPNPNPNQGSSSSSSSSIQQNADGKEEFQFKVPYPPKPRPKTTDLS